MERLFIMINKLVSKIKKMEAPIVVGLDPMYEYVPSHIMKASIEKYGETLEAVGDAIFEYNKGILMLFMI